jgi:hypothetical protein
MSQNQGNGGPEMVHLVVPISGRIKRQVSTVAAILLLLGLSFSDIFGFLKERPELWNYILLAVGVDLVYLVGQYVLDVRREGHAFHLNTILLNAAASQTNNTVKVVPPTVELPAPTEEVTREESPTL